MSKETQDILGGGDLHAIAELLTGEPPTDEEVISDAVEDAEEEAEEETTTDTESADTDAEEGEEEAETEEDEEEVDFDDEDDDEPFPESVEITDETELEIDGEKTTVYELKEGYQRKADYTKKTQELAAAKEEATASQSLAIEYLSQDIVKYEKMLEDAKQIDLVALANQDPNKFAQVQASIQQIQNKVEAETSRVTTWIKEQNEAKIAKNNEIWEATKIELKEKIPGWSQKTAKALTEYALKDLGLTGEELGEVLNAKLIIAMDKARRYDAARAKGSAAKGSPRTKAGSKTIKSRSTKSGGRSIAKQQAAMTAAQGSGDLHEVARLATEIQMAKRK